MDNNFFKRYLIVVTVALILCATLYIMGNFYLELKVIESNNKHSEITISNQTATPDEFKLFLQIFDRMIKEVAKD